MWSRRARDKNREAVSVVNWEPGTQQDLLFEILLWVLLSSRIKNSLFPQMSAVSSSSFSLRNSVGLGDTYRGWVSDSSVHFFWTILLASPVHTPFMLKVSPGEMLFKSPIFKPRSAFCKSSDCISINVILNGKVDDSTFFSCLQILQKHLKIIEVFVCLLNSRNIFLLSKTYKANNRLMTLPFSIRWDIKIDVWKLSKRKTHFLRLIIVLVDKAKFFRQHVFDIKVCAGSFWTSQSVPIGLPLEK